MNRFWIGLGVLGLLFVFPAGLPAQVPGVDRTRDVIYHRKFGSALTLDVFRPVKTNGLGAVFMVSGGWYSNHDYDGLVPLWKPLFERGYTVFAVTHGSQPLYPIPEILEDIHRAVRFIRFHAKEYGVDPDRLGIFGASAGGHLSLMQGTAGTAGDPKAKDPVNRVSSRVQAVACFYPPTDFLNYGKEGERALGEGVLKGFPAPFAFRRYDPRAKNWVFITDDAERAEIGRQISPVTHVTADDPPVLIFHGDKDFLVPIQQAQILIEKLGAAGVPAELVVKPGAGHGWGRMEEDIARIADWFDRHLVQKEIRKPDPAETAP